MAKRKTKKKLVNNMIVVSDLHCGCQLGLCPPKGVALDAGGRATPSALQQKVWTHWREFWDEWVPRSTRGEPFDVVVNGDAMDGRHHGATTQMSQNIADQVSIAREVLEPIVERCERFYLLRGTEAHGGAAGENEETLGQHLKAMPDETGNHARWELWVRVGHTRGPVCHILHHIGTTSSQAYESSALQSELIAEFAESGRAREEPPDYVVRSHRHRYLKVDNPSGRHEAACITTPAWQLKTPFVYRKAGARISQPQLGGILVRQGDEEFYTRKCVWNLKRPKIEW